MTKLNQMIYLIRGTARVHDTFEGDLKDLDGIECEDDFADFFDQAKEFGVLSGRMYFEYVCGELYTVTKYECVRVLTEQEQNILLDYTTGQWSDGIGEGFEQDPVYDDKGEEAYISPWHSGQVAKIYSYLG